MAEKWTNTSAVPSSGAMKPKPLSALNHFTVPVAISSSPLSVMLRRDLAAPTGRLPRPGSGTGPCPGHGLPQHQVADNDVLHGAARTVRSAAGSRRGSARWPTSPKGGGRGPRRASRPYDDSPFPARWRGTRDFGPSKFGSYPGDPARYVGRR